VDRDEHRGFGGEVRVGYRQAALLGAWSMYSGGPGVYVLKAEVARSVPAALGFSPLTLWIPRGALRWSWTVDEVSVVEGRIEAVLGQPTLGPLPSGG
jgi:hypothetical protein